MTDETMPSHVREEANIFDRFADAVGRITAKAWFFAACVLLVIAWAPLGLITGYNDTWHLFINTPTTIVTFLLVGLSQNTAARSNAAIQQKQNAIVVGVLRLLDVLGHEDSKEARELRAAVGIEKEESA